jgi:hypothetical protein
MIINRFQNTGFLEPPKSKITAQRYYDKKCDLFIYLRKFQIVNMITVDLNRYIEIAKSLFEKNHLTIFSEDGLNAYIM